MASLRFYFSRGRLFHKYLSFQTNGLSCTCVLINCKFWVLVANVFFFLCENFYPVDCWGKRGIICGAPRCFHLCYKAQIKIVDFESVLCVCSVSIISGDCTEKSLDPNLVLFWEPSSWGCLWVGVNLLFFFDQTKTPRRKSSQCVSELNTVPVRDGHSCKKGFLCWAILHSCILYVFKGAGSFLGDVLLAVNDCENCLQPGLSHVY